MPFTCYASGFNGLHQIDRSNDDLKQTWVQITNDLKSEPCFSLCWDSTYMLIEGDIRRNGDVIDPPSEYEKETPVRMCSAEDRLAVLYSDGVTWLWTNGSWRRLALQSAAQEAVGPVQHMAVGRHTLAACSTDGWLLTLDAVPTPAGERLQSVSCGREHVVLLTRSGRVFTYGGGSRGQLGTGDLSSSDRPRLVTALDGLTISQVSAGGWHTAALSSAGDVYTWGWNESDQLGLGRGVNVAPEPTLLEALPSEVSVTQVACGTRHTLALLEDGSVLGWGWNGYGQLTGPPSDRTGPRPLPLPADRTVVRVSAGGWGSALMTSS